jgi:hypothetical protein
MTSRETHHAAPPATRPGPSFRVGPSASVLDAIHDPGVNVAIWQRALPEDVSDALIAWAARPDIGLDMVADPSRLDLFRAVDGLDEPRIRAWLLSDLALVVGHFVALAQPVRFRLSFGAVRDDSCRKFHVDNLRLRLVTTYAGPGTEWLPEDMVDRAALSHTYEHPSDANRRIVRDPCGVRRARVGDIVALKGSRDLAPDATVGGAVHRSPPIEGTDALRVVLIVSTFQPPR